MLRQVVLLVVLMTVAPAAAATMFRLEISLRSPLELLHGHQAVQTTPCSSFVSAGCDAPGRVQVSGTAEGLVDGARQSISLNLIPVDPVEGVYAALQQWPDRGRWVLQLNGSCPGPKASASTLVPMNGSTFIREKTQVLGEPATRQQVEAALAALVRSQS